MVATIVEDSVGVFATHPDGSRVAIGHDFGDMNVWDTRKPDIKSLPMRDRRRRRCVESRWSSSRGKRVSWGFENL